MIFTDDGDYKIYSIGRFSWKNTLINHYDTPRIKHGIALITEGKFRIMWENGILEAVKGDMLFLPLNSRYKTEIASAQSYILNFENDNLKFPRPVKLLSDMQNKYSEFFDRMIKMKMRGESQFLLKSNLY